MKLNYFLWKWGCPLSLCKEHVSLCVCVVSFSSSTWRWWLSEPFGNSARQFQTTFLPISHHQIITMVWLLLFMKLYVCVCVCICFCLFLCVLIWWCSYKISFTFIKASVHIFKLVPYTHNRTITNTLSTARLDNIIVYWFLCARYFMWCWLIHFGYVLTSVSGFSNFLMLLFFLV